MSRSEAGRFSERSTPRLSISQRERLVELSIQPGRTRALSDYVSKSIALTTSSARESKSFKDLLQLEYSDFPRGRSSSGMSDPSKSFLERLMARESGATPQNANEGNRDRCSMRAPQRSRLC